MRGVYGLIVLELKLAGRGTMCGATAVFAIGLVTGALRLITGREGPFRTTGTFACAAAVPMPNNVVIAPLRQSAKNVDCFITCSTDLTSEVSISCELLQTSESLRNCGLKFDCKLQVTGL